MGGIGERESVFFLMNDLASSRRNGLSPPPLGGFSSSTSTDLSNPTRLNSSRDRETEAPSNLAGSAPGRSREKKTTPDPHVDQEKKKTKKKNVALCRVDLALGIAPLNRLIYRVAFGRS